MLYETAYRAHTGTSFSPKERAKQEQDGYFSDLKKMYDTELKKAENKGTTNNFKEKFAVFQSGYLKRYNAYLISRHGIVSTMITGGSNFPVNRMIKKNEISDKRRNELIEYYNNFKFGDKGDSGVIKTGTETALEQLKEKLRKEEEAHQLTLTYNKIMRKKISNDDKIAELRSNGVGEKIIEATIKEGFFELPNYVSSNRSGRMRELKSRISVEEKLNERKEVEATTGGQRQHSFNGGTVLENTEENRLQILFDGKPDEKMRTQLKKNGYKWSPKHSAWQRQLNTFNSYHWQFLETILDGLKKKVIEKSEPVKVEVKLTQKNTAPDVFNLNLSEITIDKARFQNRDKLNQQVLDEIVNNYSATKLDPVIVWVDPKDKKTYLLAGHHRYEGTRLLGKKTIAAKYETGTESEMIYYAKFESNANRSLETPVERAKIYREMRLSGVTKTKIIELAKKTEPKANYVIALSYLDPNGLVISSLNALQNTDKQNQSIIETIAEWIGTAKSTQTLTAAHEKEMLTFLMDKETSKRITTKADFVQKIAAICGGFDFDINKPLNLKRFKNETIGETAYDAEFKELKNKLDKAIDNKASLKARISDPKNPEFIKPTDKDYNNILVALDVAIIKYSNEIAFYQKQIIDLTRNKGKYTTAGANQIGLFGKQTFENSAFYPKYTQFENKPVQAIKHLLKEKKGDCLKALYRENIGFIDIVWGQNNDKNKGFGLKHILEKHGEEIKQLGFSIENFIPIIIQFGDFAPTEDNTKIILEGQMFRIIISKIAYSDKGNEDKTYVLSAFDLRPLWNKKKSSGLNGTYDGINFANKPLLYSTPDFTKHKPKTIPNDRVFIKKKNSLGFIVNEPAPETVVIVENNNKNSLANRIANRPAVQEYFNIYCKQIAGFLGNIERKTKESVFISLTGGRGSMKTRMCFQFMNAFAQNYKVGHASIEEHPESALYFDKAAEYLNQTALNNIEAPEIRTLQDLHELIMRNDVIVIDSYTKMKEIFKGFEVDKDLRKKYNGKLFIVIFQQTTSGAMRGGSKSEYDADIVLFTEKKDNYEKNYIYADKNRYNGQIGLTYNIFHKRLDGSTTIVAPEIKQKFKVN